MGISTEDDSIAVSQGGVCLSFERVSMSIMVYSFIINLIEYLVGQYACFLWQWLGNVSHVPTVVWKSSLH